MIPPMTTPGSPRSTIQNKLNTQVDIVSFPIPCDFDAIHKTGDGTVRPARTAVVRNVLIELLREEGFSVDVIPVEVVGNVVFD